MSTIDEVSGALPLRATSGAADVFEGTFRNACEGMMKQKKSYVGRAARRLRHYWVKLIREFKTLLGIDTPLDLHDRQVLEQVIIPHYKSRSDVKRVLFVGCAWYTRHYQKLFSAAEYWTLDFDPKNRRYGSSRHVVDGMENMREHFKPQFFDLIVCNGVYGHGLNSQEACDQAFRASFTCLREGGDFVLGWNDVPEFAPTPLDELASLKAFERRPFAPLKTSHFLTDTSLRHTFDFYVRPAAAPKVSGERTDETGP